ncbi:MAG: F0F1 ATP synthase subunit epsilon [bacterium]|nr:F0F1 ATP synthase subunit epsilon [bacterium]
MAEKTFSLDIVTPGQKVFSGDVESVVAPGTEGYFQVLTDHTPFLVTIQIGEIKVTSSGKDMHYATSGGFVEVNANRISVLAETAEKADEIELQRATESKARAEKRLESGDKELDTDRAKIALFRAINRINVAKFSETDHK